MSWLKRYTSYDLLMIAILSALGLAIKPIVTPLIHLVSSPLMIPGGSLAGGLYMMWIVLAIAIIRKPGVGTLVGLTQAIVIISLGYFGSHGVVSLLSYTLPGIVADIIAFVSRYQNNVIIQTLMCMMANITGAIVVTLIVMRLAWLPLMISLITAAISGIIGGMIVYSLYNKLKNYSLV